MFRELLAAWRKTDPLKEMYGNLISMLEAGEWMFARAWKVAAEPGGAPGAKEEIYKRDIEVNRAKHSIKKRIVEHLVVQPKVDVPACLILMSVVKDAERIGDYCKNILEVAGMEAGPVADCDFCDSFNEVFEATRAMFSKTRRAIAESDETLGHEVIYEERSICPRCDSLIERVAKSGLPAKVAVPWALLARYLKRVSAHLGNLASSIVMPIHKLDYFDEKHLQPEGGGTDDGSQHG